MKVEAMLEIQSGGHIRKDCGAEPNCPMCKEKGGLSANKQQQVLSIQESLNYCQTRRIHSCEPFARKILMWLYWNQGGGESDQTGQTALGAGVSALDIRELCFNQKGSGRIGNNKGPSLNGIPNRAFKLALKNRLFEDVWELPLREKYGWVLHHS